MTAVGGITDGGWGGADGACRAMDGSWRMMDEGGHGGGGGGGSVVLGDCPKQKEIGVLKDSPIGSDRRQIIVGVRRSPARSRVPVCVHKKQRRQPPPAPTTVQHRFCGFVSCPCPDHEAEGVPVNVRFCWRYEPLFCPPFRTALLCCPPMTS